uniref:Uncharacterized protein n=1 Tax=Vespula pensylvanica TaxID=30213 RepID=A0A834NZ10_VESPE|nr:hypothetical protein H0235_009544 [Vespula pensylvanica]
MRTTGISTTTTIDDRRSTTIDDDDDDGSGDDDVYNGEYDDVYDENDDDDDDDGGDGDGDGDDARISKDLFAKRDNTTSLGKIRTLFDFSRKDDDDDDDNDDYYLEIQSQRNKYGAEVERIL